MKVELVYEHRGCCGAGGRVIRVVESAGNAYEWPDLHCVYSHTSLWFVEARLVA